MVVHLFFSFIALSDPARVRNMPREMYLPAGLEGAIVCPFQADPPVLYVNWTKDGHSLDLDQVSLTQRPACTGYRYSVTTGLNHVSKTILGQIPKNAGMCF